MLLFGVCFVLYFIKLSAGKGSSELCCNKIHQKDNKQFIMGRAKNRKANRDTIVVEAVDVRQIFFATERAQLVVDAVV